MRGPLRVPVSPLVAGELVLDAATSRYVGRVHRRRPGDDLLLFDPGAASEADAVVVAAGREVRVRAGAPRAAPIRGLPVTLLQAVGKADKVDQVVAAATVLGAQRVVAAETERCVVVVGARAGARRERWRQVAVQSARQCGRGDIPEVLGPWPLAEALRQPGVTTGRAVVLEPNGGPLVTVLAGWDGTEPLTLAIGPEGGFTPAESALLGEHGFAGARLGGLTLRTEMAATAALGVMAALADRTLPSR